MKLSVIVPVYNCKAYLQECLDSIIAQTFSDFELICIDDASTDGSLEICQSYMRKHSFMTVIANKSNRYAGVCRNMGMEVAKGEYLLFLDADDVFEPTMFAKLLVRADETRADVCVCGADQFDTDSRIHSSMVWLLAVQHLPDKDVFSHDDCDSIFALSSAAPWNKLFRHSFVREYKLKFQSLPRTNDLYFTMSAMCLAKRISVVGDVLVHYRRGRKGGLQSRNFTTPLAFAEALVALRTRIEEEGVFGAVGDSFADLAMNVSAYNFKSLPNTVRETARVGFFKTYKDVFDIGVRPREGYTIPGNYDYMQLLEAKSPPLVSVVVPVYNVEKYLCACLDSILAQSYWCIEVVCVNDGSTDSSPEILNDYKEKFLMKGITYVVHNQSNAGLGAARNAGLRRANGKYIYFLDSDDWLLPSTLLELTALAERESLDEILFSAKAFADTPDVSQEDIAKYDHYYSIPKSECGNTTSGPALLKGILSKRGLTVSCPLKFYRRDIWINNNLSFPEGILHEDEAIAYIVLSCASRVRMVAKHYYQRRVRTGSIMTSTDNNLRKAKGYLKNIELLELFARSCADVATMELLRGRALNLFRSIKRTLNGLALNELLPSDVFLPLMDSALQRISNGQQKAVLCAKQLELARQELKMAQERIKAISPLEQKLKVQTKAAQQVPLLRHKVQVAQKEVSELRNSESYRIGLFITWPLRKIWRIIKTR